MPPVLSISHLRRFWYDTPFSTSDDMNQNSTLNHHRSRNQACPRSRRPVKLPDAARRRTVPYTHSLPVSSFEWLPRQRDPVRLFTDPLPYATNTGTPSPASSSSVITPTCLHPEGQMTPSAGAVHNLSPPNGFQSPEMCENSCTPVHTAIPLSNIRKQQKSTSVPTFHGPLMEQHQTDFWSEGGELGMQYGPPSYPQPPVFVSQQQANYSYPKQSIPNPPVPVENHHSTTASTLYPTFVSSQPAVAPPSTYPRNHPYPILHQPQPIRPIPLIPLSDLSPSHDAHHHHQQQQPSTLQDPSSVPQPPAEHALQHQSYQHQHSWHPHPQPQQIVASAHPDKADILPQSSLLFQPAPDSVRFSLTNANDAQYNNTYHITSANDGTPEQSAIGFAGVYT